MKKEFVFSRRARMKFLKIKNFTEICPVEAALIMPTNGRSVGHGEGNRRF